MLLYECLFLFRTPFVLVLNPRFLKQRAIGYIFYFPPHFAQHTWLAKLIWTFRTAVLLALPRLLD